MIKKRDTFLTNRWKRILIILPALVLMYLVSYIIDPFNIYWNDFFSRSWQNIITDLFSSFIFCLTVSESSIFISNKLNTRISWTEHPGRRFFIEALLNLIVVLVALFIINIYCFYFSDAAELSVMSANVTSIEETRGMIQWLAVSAIIAFVIIGVNTGNFLISNWKNASLKAVELNQVAMEAELQSLKLQIDPHFVFNNLSVLSELILENQQLGYEYAENFAKIYRYLLVNSKKNVILLEDELKFLHSYMFLIHHRFGEGVHFEINVDEKSSQLYMPPLTLQLLVENALKHNKTNKREPLQVSIYTNNSRELIVENVLLPIEKPMDSSGIGIKNIIRRYNLLSEKEPQIIKTDTSYKVVIPLIDLP